MHRNKTGTFLYSYITLSCSRKVPKIVKLISFLYCTYTFNLLFWHHFTRSYSKIQGMALIKSWVLIILCWKIGTLFPEQTYKKGVLKRTTKKCFFFPSIVTYKKGYLLYLQWLLFHFKGTWLNFKDKYHT